MDEPDPELEMKAEDFSEGDDMAPGLDDSFSSPPSTSDVAPTSLASKVFVPITSLEVSGELGNLAVTEEPPIFSSRVSPHGDSHHQHEEGLFSQLQTSGVFSLPSSDPAAPQFVITTSDDVSQAFLSQGSLGDISAAALDTAAINTVINVSHAHQVDSKTILVQTSHDQPDDISDTQEGEVKEGGQPFYCRVCGDSGSGYHYSVYSCEGCKGFFKRTVQKGLEYMCKEGGGCVVNKTTRNACQACRLSKCLDAGMKKESVREDRTPGGKNRLKRLRLDDGTYPPSPPLCQEAQQVLDLISRLVDARPDTPPNSEDFLGEGAAADTLDSVQLINYGYAELRMIVQWAAKVPGFSALQMEDQMALLKNTFMELIILRLAYRSLDTEGLIKFAEGVVLSFPKVKLCGWGRELISAVAETIMRLLELSLDKHEFAILNAIVLTSPDAAGLTERAAVLELRGQFSDCLRHYCLDLHMGTACPYGKILLRLPALRVAAIKAAKRFAATSLDGSMKLNQLVAGLM